MPDIAKVLKEEILRLARKELRAATADLRKNNVALKRAVGDHKRRIARLERGNRRLFATVNRRRKESMETTDEEIQRARITAKMIRSIRAKLKLSQGDLARLLGVNSQTVYQWEHKEGRLTFRGNAKAAIVAVRKLDRKQAQQRLEALPGKKVAKRKRTAKSK